jgi:hypothetical protein
MYHAPPPSGVLATQDIAAWTFLALVIILSNEGDPLDVLYIALSTAAFITVMLSAVRILLDKFLVYTLKYGSPWSWSTLARHDLNARPSAPRRDRNSYEHLPMTAVVLSCVVCMICAFITQVCVAGLMRDSDSGPHISTSPLADAGSAPHLRGVCSGAVHAAPR